MPYPISGAPPLNWQQLLEGAGTGAKVDLQSLIAGENQTFDFISVNTEGKKPTYSYSVFGVGPAASPTDIFTILGSATKTLRLLRLWISGRATAASWYRLRLLRYSTAYAAGTAVAVPNPARHDSTDGAPTGVVNTWTANPTVGTLAGVIHDDNLVLNAAALTATQPFTGNPGLLWDFTTRNGRGVVLRGVAEYVGLNGAGVALPAGTVLDIKAELTEE